jgi:anti-sigma B factor antagonist
VDQQRRFRLQTQRASGDFSTVITASGELDLAEADGLRDELVHTLGEGMVILDMRQVTFCDSAGLRALLQAHHARPARFRIAAPSTAVVRVLRLAGADTVIPVFPDLESAREG